MQRIQWFDGLRGLFCIWIILFHYTTRFSQLYNNDDILFLVTEGGKIGVLLFFVLSGFLCVMTSDKYYKEGGWKWFLKKIKRLYPSFFIVCCLLFLVDNYLVGLRDSVSLTSLVKSLLLIPMYSPTIDGAHWYVFALVRYYLVFWLILRVKLQKQFPFWVSLIFLVIINGVAKRIGVFNPCQYIIPEWIDSRMIQGVLLYYLVKDAENNVFDKRYLTLYCLNGFTIVLTGSTFYSIILLACLPLLFYKKIDKYTMPIKRVLSHKYLLYLGGISYVWYLCHQNIGYAIMQTLIGYGTNINLGIVIAFISTFLLASILQMIIKTIKI